MTKVYSHKSVIHKNTSVDSKKAPLTMADYLKFIQFRMIERHPEHECNWHRAKYAYGANILWNLPGNAFYSCDFTDVVVEKRTLNDRLGELGIGVQKKTVMAINHW